MISGSIMDPFLLEILVCPDTRGNLALAPETLLAELNAAIDKGRLHNRGGRRVSDRLDAALVRHDNVVCYPVRGDMALLLVDEQVALSQLT